MASLFDAYHVTKLLSQQLLPFGSVNTKICYRKESDLWVQLGEKIRPEEGRFLQKYSAKEPAVGNLLPFGKETICADFAGFKESTLIAIFNGQSC
jgi:hypothetical protein